MTGEEQGQGGNEGNGRVMGEWDAFDIPSFPSGPHTAQHTHWAMTGQRQGRGGDGGVMGEVLMGAGNGDAG